MKNHKVKIWRVEFIGGLFRGGDYGYEFVIGETQEQAQNTATRLFGILHSPKVTKEVETSKQGSEVTRFGVHAYFESGEKLNFEFKGE